MEQDERIYNELGEAIRLCFLKDFDKASGEDDRAGVMRSQVRALFLHAIQALWLTGINEAAGHEMLNAVYHDLSGLDEIKGQQVQ